MREQLNFRQKDIDWGRREGRTEGMNVVKRMLQEGKMNQEQLEYFLNYMKEEDEKKQSQSSTKSNAQ